MTDTPAERRPRLSPGDVEIDRGLAGSLLPRRPFGAHKWSVGGVLIIGGAPHYVGAPMLSAMAAGRAGAGVINLAVPRGLISPIASRVPEASYLILPETDALTGGRRAADVIAKQLDRVAAVVVGPGLGEDEPAQYLLEGLFGSPTRPRRIGFGATSETETGEEPAAAPLIASGKPLVIDADALNWLAHQEGWWDRLPPERAVLTPHLGEMSRLTGRSTDELAADPLTAARDAARQWRQTVVLKYGYTVVTDGVRAVVAGDAPRSLATGGSGDVLAGMIGAFLAQGLSPMDAATLAIYSGSQAARQLERQLGTLGLVASDLPAAIAGVLAELEREVSEGERA